MKNTILMLSFLTSALASAADKENTWETQRTDPILVKTRARAGSDVKEIWAEGIIHASVIDIQNTITDVDRFPKFMAYMSVSKKLPTTDADGAFYTYAKLDLPVIAARDFIHKGYIDRDATKDPQGVFANHWFSVPDKLPEEKGTVRLKISEGSWLVSPLPDGKSHVLYKLCVDPGGSIPAFAANKANADGLTDTFKNIEREAQRRATERASR